MTTPYERQINWNMSMRKQEEKEKAAAAPEPEDDRIITNAMLRAQDQDRIELLEGLLRDIYAKWREDGLYRIGDDIERICAALGE
jgi:CRISPR/Cas system CSM-associated protein Csm2 small subunit